MRRFISKTILVSLPVLIAVIAIEVLLRKIPNDYLFKKEYLDQHASDIETLILGNSHAFYGINPAFFSSKTFNASYDAQTLNYDFEILMKYQSNFKNLKTIVLPISYASLFGKLEESHESWRVKYYTIYYGIYNSKSLIDYSEVLSSPTDMSLHRLDSYYLLHNSTIFCTELGWGTNYMSENAIDIVKAGKEAANRHTEDINDIKVKTIFNENESVLKGLIEWCNNNNIKLLLLTLPAFETYYKNLNEEQLNKTIETVNSIVAENKNCIYLNLLYNTNFDIHDFHDSDHLSERGAEKISKLLDEKIKNWK